MGALESRIQAMKRSERRRVAIEEESLEMYDLLKTSFALMEKESENRDGRDVFGLSCGNCEAGTPTPHSLGCRIQSVFYRVEHHS